MAKTIDLQAAVTKILDSYGDEVADNLDLVVKEVSRTGVKKMRQASDSTFEGSGAYGKAWTSQTETGRTSAQGTIYNKKPGLPHLLEHGHAMRNGGRVPGREHIKPVEEELIDTFTKELEGRL